MSFRTDDERRLLLAFLLWLAKFDDPNALPDGEIVAAFIAERESR